MQMYQMKVHFKGFPKLVITPVDSRGGEICSQTSRPTIGKLQRKELKVLKFFLEIIFPAFFEPVSAALLLLETAVIALIWVMIQPKTFLTSLLATVLQLKEQYRYRNGCKNHSVILF